MLLTCVTLFSLFDQSDEEKKEMTARLTSELVKNTKTQTVTLRKPASIDSRKIQTDSLKVKIFCDKHSPQIFSQKSLVMLELGSCKELYGTKRQLWVKNISNGFKAQVFKTKEQIFRTDFLQLNSGSNKIEVQGVLKDGQMVTETLEIQSGS